MKAQTLRLVGVPARVPHFFTTLVNLSHGSFYIPMWLVQDCMDTREPVDPIKFDVAIDARRQRLVLNPLVYAPGTRLARAEFRGYRCRLPQFYRLALPQVLEIFQLEGALCFPVTVHRASNALIVNLKAKKELEACTE